MIKLGEVFKKHKFIVAVGCLAVIGGLTALFLTVKPEAPVVETPKPDVIEEMDVPQKPDVVDEVEEVVVDANLKLGAYVCETLTQENGLIVEPVVTLQEGNQYGFHMATYSSFLIFDAPYEVEGNTLRLTYENPEGDSLYVFQIQGDTLVLDLEACENPRFGGVEIPDGAKFHYEPASQGIIGGADGPTEIVIEDSGDRVQPREMTQEEVDFFNQSYFNTDDYDYLANQFLLDDYDTPAGVDLAMLFYNGIGVDYAMSEEELGEVTQAYGFDELPTDVTVVPSGAMNRAWSQFMGFPMAEGNLRALSSFLYIDKYDCYYHLHGDVNRYGDVTFTRGEQKGNVVELFYHNTWFDQDFVMRLTQYEDGSYKIYSNLPE